MIYYNDTNNNNNNKYDNNILHYVKIIYHYNMS